MPAVSFSREVTEGTNSIRYLGIHFNRKCMYKTQTESTKHICKKELLALKAIAAKSIEQRLKFMLHQSVIASLTMVLVSQPCHCLVC